MKYISSHEIEDIGKEFDYNWRDMAEKIIELLSEVEELETTVRELEKQLATKEE